MYTRAFKTFVSLSASEIESKLKEAFLNDDCETVLKLYDECTARVAKRMEQKKKLYLQLVSNFRATSTLYADTLQMFPAFKQTPAHKQFLEANPDSVRSEILKLSFAFDGSTSADTFATYKAIASCKPNFTPSPTPTPIISMPTPTLSPSKEEEKSNKKVTKVRKIPSRKPKTKTPAKGLADAVMDFNEHRAEVERLANEMEDLKEKASEDDDEMIATLTKEITKIVDEESKKSEECYLNNGNITSTLENIYHIMETNKVSTAELVQFLMTKGA